MVLLQIKNGDNFGFHFFIFYKDFRRTKYSIFEVKKLFKQLKN